MANRNVFQRGGVWFIRYEEPRGPDGKRRQRMLSCKGMTKKQAEQRLRDILSSLNNGNYIDPASMSFADYLERWLAYSKDRLSPKTHERYVETCNSHVIPALGALKLDKIRPLHIQSFCSNALRKGRVDGNGGLAPKTVKNLLGMIHAALAQAVRWQLLTVNPADAVEPPRVRRTELKTASSDDITKLFAAIERSKYKTPILIVLATGMRRGEVAGLKWEDFDPQRKTLVIRRSLCQLRSGVIEKETKTGRPRIVMVPDMLVAELEAHRRDQEAIKELLGSEYQDGCWICAGPMGERPSPKWLGNQFSRLARSVGVNITLHGLRHTQATALIMAGVPVKVVSERLGHSTVTITQDIYAHVLPHMQQEAAEVMEGILRASRKQEGSQAPSEGQ